MAFMHETNEKLQRGEGHEGDAVNERGGPEMLRYGDAPTRPPGQVRWWSTFTRPA